MEPFDRSQIYATDERLGKTEPERIVRGLRWQRRCEVLNVIALIICFTVAPLTSYDGGRYYWALLLVIGAMPPLALIMVWFSYGAVDLFNSIHESGPSVLVLVLSPLLLAWRAFDWHVVDSWIVWAGALCLSVPVTLQLSRVTRAAGHSLAIRGPLIFALSTLYIGSVVVLVDVGSDRNEPQSVQAEVAYVTHRIATSSRRARYLTSSAFVRLRPWSLQPNGGKFRTGFYAVSFDDRYCDVEVHPGALGFRWLDLGDCHRDAPSTAGDIARP